MNGWGMDDRIQEHLRHNPWLRGPYEELKRMEQECPSVLLQPGADEEALYFLSMNMRKEGVARIPETYWSFLWLVGGLTAPGMWLYGTWDIVWKGRRYTSYLSGTRAQSGLIAAYMVYNYDNTELFLGECDHGTYTYWPDTDSYGLNLLQGGYNHFADCIDMLRHINSRIRANASRSG